MKSDISYRWRSLLVGALALALTGCRIAEFPDPNVSLKGQILPAKVLYRNFEAMHIMLERRLAKGEITKAQKDTYVKNYADATLNGIDITRIPKHDAWGYADVFRQAGRWETSYSLLKIAVDAAPNEDRRVNDLLKLAWAEAKLGKVNDAIKHCRDTFNTPPEFKAPILYGVLYEVIPAAEGKGKDIELGQLLEQAIEQHRQVIVNPESDSGKAFLSARDHHIFKAWDKVMLLYTSNNRNDLAEKALSRSESSAKQTATL